MIPAPLVLVHGWGGSAANWDAMPFPSGSRSCAVDLPGHGSARETGPFSIRSAVEAVLHRVETLGEPAVLVGHSMGAQITTIVHAERPELVLAECVIDPAYGHPESDRERMIRWRDEVAAAPHAVVSGFVRAAFSARADPGLRRRILEDVVATPERALVAYLDAQYFADGAVGFAAATRELLLQRSRPTLGVYSTEPAAAFERSAGAADTVVQPGGGHYLHLESPSAFVRTLTAWLDERT